MPTITAAPEPDLALIRAIDAGQAVRVEPALLDAVRQRREKALAALRDGRLVYGVNTGMGKLSTVRLTEEQQWSHQRNLLLARAVGGPPWLDVAEARSVLAVRLVTFLSADAAVSAELCQRLADFLNDGIVPAVPRTGAGAAGEITHLAHAFGPWGAIAACGSATHAPKYWRRCVILNVPPFKVFGQIGSRYEQNKSSFYFWFFQMQIAGDVVAADDLAFIDGL